MSIDDVTSQRRRWNEGNDRRGRFLILIQKLYDEDMASKFPLNDREKKVSR